MILIIVVNLFTLVIPYATHAPWSMRADITASHQNCFNLCSYSLMDSKLLRVIRPLKTMVVSFPRRDCMDSATYNTFSPVLEVHNADGVQD